MEWRPLPSTAWPYMVQLQQRRNERSRAFQRHHGFCLLFLHRVAYRKESGIQEYYKLDLRDDCKLVLLNTITGEIRWQTNTYSLLHDCFTKLTMATGSSSSSMTGGTFFGGPMQDPVRISLLFMALGCGLPNNSGRSMGLDFERLEWNE